jgi:hypothetical protein
MEMGTFHEVVWYFIVQKIMKLMTDHNFDQSTTQKPMEAANSKLKSNIKEKCLSRYNGSCPLSRELFTAHKDPKSECNFTKNL